MTRLFRELGWPETPESDEHHRTFQCTNGCVVALYAARHYEPHFGPVAEGFRGVVLSVNVESFDEVKRIHESMRGVDGVMLHDEPTEAFWGGGFGWRDPEGNEWTSRGRRAPRWTSAAASRSRDGSKLTLQAPLR